MSQWGSKSLADDGYSTIDILRYYYGDSMYINTAEEIAGIPASWPGSDLTVGSTGAKVLQMQEQLNAIANVYTSIPKIAEDGIFGSDTAAAVRQFQSIFGLGAIGNLRGQFPDRGAQSVNVNSQQRAGHPYILYADDRLFL